MSEAQARHYPRIALQSRSLPAFRLPDRAIDAVLAVVLDIHAKLKAVQKPEEARAKTAG